MTVQVIFLTYTSSATAKKTKTKQNKKKTKIVNTENEMTNKTKDRKKANTLMDFFFCIPQKTKLTFKHTLKNKRKKRIKGKRLEFALKCLRERTSFICLAFHCLILFCSSFFIYPIYVHQQACGNQNAYIQNYCIIKKTNTIQIY